MKILGPIFFIFSSMSFFGFDFLNLSDIGVILALIILKVKWRSFLFFPTFFPEESLYANFCKITPRNSICPWISKNSIDAFPRTMNMPMPFLKLIVASLVRLKVLLKSLLNVFTHAHLYYPLFLLFFNEGCNLILLIAWLVFLHEIFLNKASLKKLLSFLKVMFKITSVLPINTGNQNNRQNHNTNHGRNGHNKIVGHWGLWLIAQSFAVI